MLSTDMLIFLGCELSEENDYEVPIFAPKTQFFEYISAQLLLMWTSYFTIEYMFVMFYPY